MKKGEYPVFSTLSNSRGQAGLDFLMSYGWALFIIVLVVGSLFAMGIFNVSLFAGDRISGFTSIGVTAYRLTPAGVFTVQFINRAGNPINITGVSYTLEGQNTPAPVAGWSALALTPGQLSPIQTLSSSIPNVQPGYYSVALNINYTVLKTGFQYGEMGTLYGKVA